jgi:hypothetical protein
MKGKITLDDFHSLGISELTSDMAELMPEESWWRWSTMKPPNAIDAIDATLFA